MPFQDPDLLLRLLLAHFIADFLTGTEPSPSTKGNLLSRPKFYLHIGLVGALTYALAAHQWSNWWLPLTLMILHAAIDWGRAKVGKDTTAVYLIDLSLHLLTILICWLLATTNTFHQLLQLVTAFFQSSRAQLILLGYIVVSIPGGHLIGYLTSRWREEMTAFEEDPSVDESLQNAGRWIGILERVLILTFVLAGDWRPIGFLLAAKSVFRFGELKESQDRKRTEYILIGTLLSFTLSITIGLLIQYLAA